MYRLNFEVIYKSGRSRHRRFLCDSIEEASRLIPVFSHYFQENFPNIDRLVFFLHTNPVKDEYE